MFLYFENVLSVEIYILHIKKKVETEGLSYLKLMGKKKNLIFFGPSLNK